MADLIDLYRRIIDAIREVDPHHLVLLTGKALSTDFSFYECPLDDNQAYTFHTYNFLSHDIGESQMAKLADVARAHDVPLWNGEFGAHTAAWVASQVGLLEASKAENLVADEMMVEALESWKTAAPGLSDKGEGPD